MASGLIEFSSSISLGNLLTIFLIILGGLRAWFAIKERASKTAEKLEELTKRINSAELERLKVCVETMWLFQLRRGVAEIEHKQLGSTNSPVQLTDEANTLMESLRPELKSFYSAIHGEEMGLVELAIELERQFGDRLSTEVCKRIGISDAACMVLAIAQLRPIGHEHLRQALEECEDAKDLKEAAKQFL